MPSRPRPGRKKGELYGPIKTYIVLMRHNNGVDLLDSRGALHFRSLREFEKLKERGVIKNALR